MGGSGLQYISLSCQFILNPTYQQIMTFVVNFYALLGNFIPLARINLISFSAIMPLRASL